MLDALTIRSRYRRASTFSTGQVAPLTTIVLPKNSGFHIGDRSLFGMYGPPGVTSPKKSRLLGKNSEPSVLNERSCSISGISNRPDGSTPAGTSAGPPRMR